ncbi:hypothetical protein C5167_022971 [Papaver somniferum]|uniref:Uncharacterized protein n=1 Tax=Papaver somniferum TaxID=3469 RepID=A0A4Y7JNA3_PAPSO|nr:hypothetical protein C5167_022971 [Papaver somniferum]
MKDEDREEDILVALTLKSDSVIDNTVEGNPEKEKEPQELPMCDISTMMVKQVKWIARGLVRNIEEVLYLDCDQQKIRLLRLQELHNPAKDDLYTNNEDDCMSGSQTPHSSSSSSEDVPKIVGRSG